ncbi:hypothetical protein Sango_1093100 [Sesamum angolense]|uniref:Nucleolar protein 14 n=1 Tax=Sesamum angolense TaxID=2727404 RepID=A0AAE1WUQ1_9LAMI|nr:hypothetical protein Sango_1093100 [Sesamum angolense]
MAKKSSTESSKKKKNKSKNKINSKLSILNSEAKKTKAPKENPFESVWSRRKFDILGKNRKDDERRRVGLSRSLAIQKRQKTLLKEYEQSTKSSVFVDKRIGEQNEGLGEFDKAILRSQRERQLKLKKKSKYNLSDGEEDEFEIQDSGYFLERDDFEDEEPLDEDEADQSVGSDKKLMLGRVNNHEAEPDLELRSAGEENSEALLSLTQPNKMRALKALVNNSISNDNAKKQETNIAQNKVPPQQEKPDHYDKLVGEMALDMRARPSDRTKAPEELAQEEKERLEQLEEERQKRMVGADDSTNEDANSSEEDDVESSKQIRHISGDDLGDSFSHEDKPRTKVGWIDEILRRKNDSELESDDAASSGESEDEEERRRRRRRRRRRTAKKRRRKDLMGTMMKMTRLNLSRTGNRVMMTILKLIWRKKNKMMMMMMKKMTMKERVMMVFYGVLLQYFAVLANKKLLNFKLLNMLVKPLMEMSTEIPYFAAICARQRLLRTRTHFCEDVKLTGKSCWPSLKTLFLLRLWSMIFPCSDFRHAVMTPAILLMSEYLMRCPITSGRDIAIGSFLCSMVLSKQYLQLNEWPAYNEGGSHAFG